MKNTATTEPKTPQQRIQQLLAKSGIAYKEIKVYGSQIVITAWSLEAANKWAMLITRFAKVRGVIESRDDNKVNTNTVMLPDFHRVWRVFGVID
jgi:hypothetical protein